MFSNKYRLRNTTEIAKVFKIGKYVHGKYIFIKYIPNKQETVRIAISVSTKMFKQAVKRNRIKRLLRESIQPHLTTLPNLDILIIAKKELTMDTLAKDINADIKKIFRKL